MAINYKCILFLKLEIYFLKTLPSILCSVTNDETYPANSAEVSIQSEFFSVTFSTIILLD